MALKSLKTLTFAAFVIFFDPMLLFAQRTGNIVEIFGKEKIEHTDEGEIIHHFVQGLLLKNAMIPGMLTGGQDIVFWQLATGSFNRPYAGQVLGSGYKNPSEPLIWEQIEADSAGVFRGELSRSCLYTEYESDSETFALLDATGHTRVYINGMPHEGDHYDYGWTLIPFRLKKGLNQIIYTYGRFPRVSSKIVIPKQEVQFSKRDMTLPSIIRGESAGKWGAVRVVNASENHLSGLSIVCSLSTGESADFKTDDVMPLLVRKLKFQIPAPKQSLKADSLMATIALIDKHGKELDRLTFKLNLLDANRHHERTFISNIDGSVQYFSVAPSTSGEPSQAFVLSVHGASVEATNQVRAYRQKDWAHIVAPTNRRPFGFNWEEWGRLDALEVLHEGRKLFHTDTSRTYLTGHSMGGHGTWFLGATYPDRWAAIAPAAGYPDIIGYRRGGSDSTLKNNPHFDMIHRGALAGRTLDLARNFLQSGVYVLHGDADAVVPVTQARQMREVLGGFHNNFAYYEYPSGSHWYGDHCMDWPPLFDFLKQNTIPASNEVQHFEFVTASPAVSASCYWLCVNQQVSSYKHTRIEASQKNDTIRLKTENARNITLRLPEMKLKSNPVILIDSQTFVVSGLDDASFAYENDRWQKSTSINLSEKHPGRYGGFKLAFDNNVVFVYATRGDEAENQWYLNKARFDAETFLYRGNSSVEVILDSLFAPEKYPDRNVILYGNSDNNLAWDRVLENCPVRVSNGSIAFGSQTHTGDDLGAYFIYPRRGSDKASVGVVAGTGLEGMKATYGNDYFSGITGFPDLLIFDVDWVKDGLDGVKISGFFGVDWSVEQGEWERDEGE